MTDSRNALEELPLFGRDMMNDPYPVYERLRATDPVYWSYRFNAWIVTGFEAVVAGLNDLRLASDRSGLLKDMAHDKDIEPLFSFLSKRMVFADPPLHTRLRGLLNKAFTPHVVEAMRTHIVQLVNGFLDAVMDQGKMDFIRDFAFPLPATVITEMLGVNSSDRDQLKKWSDDFVIFFSTHPAQIKREQYLLAVAGMQKFVAYFEDALARVRKDMRQCLLQLMEHAEMNGNRLTEQELIANANLLLIAGHETTTNLLGNGLLALLRHPDQLQKLREDPSLIPMAIEEMLRYDGPVQFTNRVAKEDVVLDGKTIRKGQFVFLFLAAANRDPVAFPDPNRFDIARASHKHVAFGLGHHFCLGAPLARLEAHIAFETLLKRLPKLRLATDKLEYGENFNLHGLKSMPVTF
jgi:pimeloyl-[acyl-carrier protein] synthase